MEERRVGSPRVSVPRTYLACSGVKGLDELAALALDSLRSLGNEVHQGGLGRPQVEERHTMRVTPRRRSGRCLDCGTRVRGSWTWCWRCWQVKRAAGRSLHWQLERVATQVLDQAQLLELERLKVHGTAVRLRS